MSIYERLFNIFIPKTLEYDLKPDYHKDGYEIVTAINEAGEEIILEFPKFYKGLARV
jgi:hypothetical protein